ncbi:hypothetical protein BDW75DRAFT_244870 [Aspergillus navahoensis]
MPSRPQDFNNLYLSVSHGFCSARGYHSNDDKQLLTVINQSLRFDNWAKVALFAAEGNGDVHLCPTLCNDADAREDIRRVMGRLCDEMNKYGENLMRMRAAAQTADLERREQEHRRREQQHHGQQGRAGQSGQSGQDDESGRNGQNGENGQQGEGQEPQGRRRALRQRIRRVSWASPLSWGFQTPPPMPQDHQDQSRYGQHGQHGQPQENGGEQLGNASANASANGSPIPDTATLQAVSEEEDTLYRAIERALDELYDICPVGLVLHDENGDVPMHEGDAMNGNAGMNGDGNKGDVGGANGVNGDRVENE